MPTMPTTAAMQARFAAAGLYTSAVWTPQPQGMPITSMVDFRDPTLQVLVEEGAISAQPTAQWARGQFAGAKRGDKLSVTHPHTGLVVHYQITELHKVGTVGDTILAELEAWSAP